MIILTVTYSNEESVIDMLITIVKYILRPKKYVHIPNKKDTLDLVTSKDNFM